MLTGLAKPLVEGQSFPMTLDFAKAGQRQVTVRRAESRGNGAGRRLWIAR